jgi:predicted RNA-binding protein YlxR (DUF448 family)
MRTCTGCRTTAPQRELVRLAFDGARVIISRRLEGRGAYVHAKTACVTASGLSRGLRKQVRPADVARIVDQLSRSEMSQSDDNWGAEAGDQPLRNASQNAPGLADGDTVEMPPRMQAKDDRSEDARL